MARLRQLETMQLSPTGFVSAAELALHFQNRQRHLQHAHHAVPEEDAITAAAEPSPASDAATRTLVER